MAADVSSEVDRYLALPYRIELIPDDGEWVVSIPDLPGCLSQGASPAEAIVMIREAQRLWLEVALRHGDGIPLPQPVPLPRRRRSRRQMPTAGDASVAKANAM